MFSGDRKIPTRGSTVPMGNAAGPAGPRIGIFLSTLNFNDQFFFSYAFTNDSFSLFEHGTARGKRAKQKNSAKSNKFGTEMFLMFLLRKRIPTLYIFIHK